jgi:hypothetical protein
MFSAVNYPATLGDWIIENGVESVAGRRSG